MNYKVFKRKKHGEDDTKNKEKEEDISGFKENGELMLRHLCRALTSVPLVSLQLPASVALMRLHLW